MSGKPIYLKQIIRNERRFHSATYVIILSRGRLQMGFGLGIGFIEHLQNVTTNNYDSLTELHAPKITVTTAHIKSSVFTSRCLVVAFNGGCSTFAGFPNCSEPQLPVSHFSYNSQPTQPTTELLVLIL
jgi:hypothetical protein